MNYPTNWNWRSEQEHLLFDIGYSYALLRRCRDVLSELEFDEAFALVVEIQALFEGRQQTTTEIYDAADKVYAEMKHEKN